MDEEELLDGHAQGLKCRTRGHGDHSAVCFSFDFVGRGLVNIYSIGKDENFYLILVNNLSKNCHGHTKISAKWTDVDISLSTQTKASFTGAHWPAKTRSRLRDLMLRVTRLL